MSNYTVTTDFGAKDALTTGDPSKVVRGSELTTEFTNIATAITSKFDSADVAVLSDATFRVVDNADVTKKIALEASGITTGNTRTLTVQDKSYTIADNADLQWFHGQCQLQYVSSTTVKLMPYNGNKVIINGAIYVVPYNSGNGVAFGNGSTLVEGSGVAASTKYYLYVRMNAGVMEGQLSATAYEINQTTGVYQRSGDATRTLVGMVYTDAGSPGTFASSATKRWVRSWFNDPGVVTLSSYSVDRNQSSASYAEINSEIRNNFIVWDGEVVQISLSAVGTQNTGGQVIQSSIGIDSTTGPQDCYSAQQPSNVSANYGTSFTFMATGLSEGLHYVTHLGATGSGTVTWRGGSAGARSTLTAYLKR